MTRVNDLLEDNEGDKAVVVAVNEDGQVQVRWDCSGQVGGWMPASLFSNLSDIVHELDAERQHEPVAKARGKSSYDLDREDRMGTAS